jgi:predicted TIM-barrel fold metal-dependent hydrolase
MHACMSEIRATFVWRGWMETRSTTSHSVCVIVSFGVERMAFGGEWAVAIQASSYWRWVGALDTITASRLLGEQRRLWSDNAHGRYRLTAAE